MQLSGYFRQLKSTFAIDIDFEYNLKEIQRLNNKDPSECYTNIYQKSYCLQFFLKSQNLDKNHNNFKATRFNRTNIFFQIN